ncbi:MAG: hypothetical protein MMC33_000172 [Icmadophila ericetorum]|nr:hypothetical protein [Icmadophila ericetorum]
MEPSPGSPTSSSHHRRQYPSSSRPSSVDYSSLRLNIGEGSSEGTSRQGLGLRREHSDGDVLAPGKRRGDWGGSGTGDSRVTPVPPQFEPGETWIDFIRKAPADAGEDVQEHARTTVRRAAMLAAVDRKRRLQEQSKDQYNRRRSATSSIPLGQANRDRLRQQLSEMGGPSGNGGFRSPSAHQRIMEDLADRPLPPTPSAVESSQIARPNFEIVLPRWQPDHEVSECPICGKVFAFWFRKHHCRKCGRVVCANCSPHRITIPRQFIIHAPEEQPPAQPHFSTMDNNVVDLTVDDPNSPSRVRRSHEFGLSSALGGGQEVRLCNPCVPDPNPCPPPVYPSTRPHSLVSFPSSENFTTLPQRATPPERPSALNISNVPSGPYYGANTVAARAPTSGSPSTQVPPYARPYDRNVRLQRHESHRRQTMPAGPSRGSSFDSESRVERRSSLLPLQTGSSAVPAESGTQEERIAAMLRHPPFPQYPFPVHRSSSTSSNGPPAYGSAPGTSSHEAYINSLLARHPSHSHHRHHSSASVVPSAVHQRYRSMLDISSNNNPLPPPPGPQTQPVPQLREEDECPVCHSALPPKGPNDDETPREAHIAACIETHFSSSGPRTTPSQAPNQQSPHLVTPVAIPTGPGVRRQNSGNLSSTPDTPTSMSVPRRRVTGMLTYLATEKDCLGAEDGAPPQECVICFEEFCVGDEMGRLECLCKFHKVGSALTFRGL